MGKFFEKLNHNTVFTVVKYKNRKDYNEGKFYEKSNIYGNVLLNSGINFLWKVFAGGKESYENYFDNSNAYIGVGNDDTPESSSQTDLIGMATYKGMDTGYPQYGTDQKIIFKATFNETEGNMDWKEFCVTNYSHALGTSGVVLNRKVSDKGTKSAGEIWEVYVSITLT